MRRLRAATRHFALAQPRPRQLERPRVGGAQPQSARPRRAARARARGTGTGAAVDATQNVQAPLAVSGPDMASLVSPPAAAAARAAHRWLTNDASARRRMRTSAPA